MREPIPDARIPVRHHDEGGLAERAGEMRGGVADGDDEIAGVDQRRQAVVGVVDVVESLDANSELALDLLALGACVAILQIDEAAAGQAQQAFEVAQRRAFQRTELRVGAAPRQSDDDVAAAREAPAIGVAATGIVARRSSENFATS